MEQPAEDSVHSRLSNFFATPEAAPPKQEPKAETQPTAQVAEQETQAEASEPEQAEDDGLDDLDLEGTVYRVPKELKAKVSEYKDGYLRQSDYTKKTQETADITRQALAMAETIQLRANFDKETEKERHEAAKLDAELSRYKQVDWPNLDTETYIKLKGQMDILKDQKSDIDKTLEKKTKEVQEKFTEQRKKAIQDGLKYLQKAIPSFGPEAVDASRKGASTAGYTENELENVYDARFMLLSWKAAQFDKLQSTKPAVTNIKAPPVIKPGATGQAPAERKYKDSRDELRKTGSIESFARALKARGIK